MKKIQVLISLVLINFCAYSQTIPEVPINQFTQAGYLNSKYYPIGWSEDERYFALMILRESNYASLPEGHGFDFLVKDVVTDKDAYIKSYSGYDICEGKFDAYGQGECDFSAKGIFELHKATFTEALNKYNINTKTPLTYSTFPIKNAEGESISIQNYKVEKDGYISKETLTATNNQQGSKTILQSTYDSNFRRLTSEIVGAFVSPSKERLLVIQKYTRSGIEGDRDIELNFIGCHTQKGYQFDDDKVDISNAPIKKDREDIYAETKFKRGQYKVFLNEIDEKAAAGNQGIDKNNFINTTEIIMNISDDINGIYSYFSWGYDSQSCKFSSGETKNENTVGFTLECSSEGNTYDAGSYSIEIIDESTLRWKSDDGRFEKDFNYTFIPEE